ncbi:FAD-dependent oxidoreductase [Sciscionella sediminilitoris]|uniref:FAD-dependent oxidoreductase n=1 Tax=Sciscionella sediminilitoris TaxID=1445613 RepID=UPI00056BA324|nr:FAD-dependent oxidoreductase [Sciscionella sp. SE31]
MSPRSVLVLGYGMAAARFAEQVRRSDPDGELVRLTVLGAEDRPAYNRVLLSPVLAGSVRAEHLALHRDSWHHRRGIAVRTGCAAVRIDRAARIVECADGSSHHYDELVLATGARPWLPPVDGLREEDGALTEGVRCLRTLADTEYIVDRSRGGGPIAVLGGGVLGIEAARALALRGNPVTVVHPAGHPMQRQLDPEAGRVLGRVLSRLGVEVRLEARARRYLPGDGLKLDDGTLVPAELLVLAAGTRPRTELAQQSGITVDSGILVDDLLRTNDPRVHAIGDCARHPGAVPGLVQPAYEQADALAATLTGNPAPYRGTSAPTRLKADGIELTAFGDSLAGTDDPAAEVCAFSDPAGGRYAKLVVREDRVHGAILLGFPDAAATLAQCHHRGVPVPEDRLPLLFGRALPGSAGTTAGPADLPGGSVVCQCNSVTKSALVKAFTAGARGTRGLAEATRASTGCGGCLGAVGGIARWLAESEGEETTDELAS